MDVFASAKYTRDGVEGDIITLVTDASGRPSRVRVFWVKFWARVQDRGVTIVAEEMADHTVRTVTRKAVEWGIVLMVGVTAIVTSYLCRLW